MQIENLDVYVGIPYHKVSIKLQDSWHVVIYIFWGWHIVINVQ